MEVTAKFLSIATRLLVDKNLSGTIAEKININPIIAHKAGFPLNNFHV
jgi:hypothetical protein